MVKNLNFNVSEFDNVLKLKWQRRVVIKKQREFALKNSLGRDASFAQIHIFKLDKLGHAVGKK